MSNDIKRSVRLFSDEVFGCNNEECDEYRKNVYPVCTKCGYKLGAHINVACKETISFDDSAKAHVNSPNFLRNMRLEIGNKLVDAKLYYTKNEKDLKNIGKNVSCLVIPLPGIGTTMSLLEIKDSILNLKGH